MMPEQPSSSNLLWLILSLRKETDSLVDIGIWNMENIDFY